MKILAVCQYYRPEPFVIYKFLEQLAAFGHEVHVVTGFPNYGYNRIMDGYDGSKEMDEIIEGVYVHRVPIYPRKNSKLSICKNYLSFWKSAKKYVRKLDDSFDVVFTMTLSPVIAASAANWYAKKYHKPLLHYCVDLWPESLVTTGAIHSHGLAYHFFYRWSKKIYQRADKILVSSPSFLNYFKEVLHLTEKDYGILYQPALIDENDDEEIYEEGTINIVYCGNLGKLQCLPLIDEMLEKIKDHPKIRFHFIGMGSEKKHFLERIQKKGLEKMVVDHGPLPSKKAIRYFKNADALYVALTGKGYVGHTIPNKLVFYLAFKKPILAMVNYDARDVLLAANGSIIVEENADSLYEGVQTLLRLTKEEKEKMGKNNQDYFKAHFHLSILSRKLEEELHSLIKEANSSATTDKE